MKCREGAMMVTLGIYWFFLSRGSLKNHCTKATLELKPLSSSHEYIQPTNFTLRNLLWPTRKNLTKQNLVLL